MSQARCPTAQGIKERLKSHAPKLGPQWLKEKGAPLTNILLEVLIGETFLKGKVKLERVKDMQLPFAHVEYFSPMPTLKDQSPGLLRQITASFLEEEDAKRGGEWNVGERGEIQGLRRDTPLSHPRDS